MNTSSNEKSIRRPRLSHFRQISHYLFGDRVEPIQQSVEENLAKKIQDDISTAVFFTAHSKFWGLREKRLDPTDSQRKLYLSIFLKSNVSTLNIHTLKALAELDAARSSSKSLTELPDCIGVYEAKPPGNSANPSDYLGGIYYFNEQDRFDRGSHQIIDMYGDGLATLSETDATNLKSFMDVLTSHIAELKVLT